MISFIKIIAGLKRSRTLAELQEHEGLVERFGEGFNI